MRRNEAAGFERVRRRILERREVFSRQGAVVAGWRTYEGRRLGPFYRLVYHEAGKSKAIYLGRDERVAEEARGLLAQLQRPRKEREALERTLDRARAGLRDAHRRLAAELAAVGVGLKGWEFRGLDRALGAAADPENSTGG